MNFFIKTNKNKSKKKGYISFSKEDLRQQALASQENAEAYRLLEAAMSTNSNIAQTDADGHRVVIEDVYPCTLLECDEMDGLLNQAEAAVRDPNDAVFPKRLKELRSIVKWSRKKHWTIKRPLVFGCALTIFLIFLYNHAFCGVGTIDFENRELVEKWVEQDTSIVWPNCEKKSEKVNYESAIKYKTARLQNYKYEYDNVLSKVDRDRGRLEFARNQSAKDSLQQHMQELEREMAQIKADYDVLNRMHFKDLKKKVLSQMNGNEGLPPIEEEWILIYLIACGVIVPLYIYTSRRWGYYITLHRHEVKTFTPLERIGFSITEFLLGKGMALALLPDYEVPERPEKKKYTPVNFFLLLLHALLILPFVLIYSVFSLFTMAYAIVIALKRNYSWHKLDKRAAQAVAKRVVKKKAAEN